MEIFQVFEMGGRERWRILVVRPGEEREREEGELTKVFPSFKQTDSR
jgi:hypothetical protein